MKTDALVSNVHYQMKLEDCYDEKSSISLKMEVSPGDHLLMIGAEGYGEMTANDGNGFPVVIEYVEKTFRILVWGDINREEPTHVISLEGAREDVREVADGD